MQENSALRRLARLLLHAGQRGAPFLFPAYRCSSCQQERSVAAVTLLWGRQHTPKPLPEHNHLPSLTVDHSMSLTSTFLCEVLSYVSNNTQQGVLGFFFVSRCADISGVLGQWCCRGLEHTQGVGVLAD